MKIPSLQIGDLTATMPIVQGGMGVGISMSGLAGSVAAQGGIGVISAVGIGFYRPDVETNKIQANIAAIHEQVRKAREIAPNGIIGVNIMVAIREFDELVRASIDAGADIIFAGAGLPSNLPEVIGDSSIKIAPIISSGKAAAVICRAWTRKGYTPDAIVLEGPLAGGHLGFKVEDLEDADEHTLERILVEVLEAIKPFEEAAGRPIPVIAGGGVWDGNDIARLLKLGASGVQMATRFVATEECDASMGFKQAYLDAQGPEDLMIIRSPVGLPGRALRNHFLERVSEGETIPTRCTYTCLKTCKPLEAPYCIANVLISAQKGALEEGFAFAGTNAWRCTEITTVKALMAELKAELEAFPE